MKNLLLGIIAINLTFLSIITTLNYMQTANAQLVSQDVQKVSICNPSGDKCGDDWFQLVHQIPYKMMDESGRLP